MCTGKLARLSGGRHRRMAGAFFNRNSHFFVIHPTTFEIIQAIICALLLINIGIMIAASLDRKSRRYAKEVIRETLRMKMLASRDLGKYALYVSPSCVKVALAGDHQLALLSLS